MGVDGRRSDASSGMLFHTHKCDFLIAPVPTPQPYVDLMHGGSLPRRSLLLDYTRTKFVWGIVLSLHWLRSSSNALVWVKATSNRHYIVALASLTALLALSFQPVSASLFIVRGVYMAFPGSGVAITFVFSSLTSESQKQV